MGTKHTPGPWEVEDRRAAALKNIRIVAGTHEVAQVSDVHQRDVRCAGFDPSTESKAADLVDALGLANARLIAAAPELAKACQKMFSRMDDWARNGNVPDGLDKEAMNAALSALTAAGVEPCQK